MPRRLQGTIRQRGDAWQVTISTGRGADGRYHRQSFTCATEEEAQDKLMRLNMEKRTGELTVERLGSLAEFLDDWLAGVIKPNRSARTHELYKMICNRYLKAAPLASAKVERIRPQDVQAYYAALLANGVSVSMVHHVHRTLRVALNQAVDWGYMTRNPAARLKLPRHEAREYKVLTAEEARRLIQSLHDADPKKERARWSLWAPVAVALGTGLRIGELLALRWSDIDLKKRTLTVRHTVEEVGSKLRLKAPKTKSSRRTVPLHDDTVQALSEHRRRQNALRLAAPLWEDNDLVFPDTTIWFSKGLPAGRIRSPRAMEHIFRREMRSLGLEGLRFHDLRHSHITHLLLAGIDVKTVSARVGHASAAMTLDRYAHLLPGSQEAAVQALDGLLGGPAEERPDRRRRDPR